MRSRRAFIAGLLAAGAVPRASWADAGAPAFLTAGLRADGVYVLCGLDRQGEITFERPLPARGHAAAAHPTRPEAVAFARRPGTYAMVLDCATGTVRAQLEAPAGRHFYGHGTFSAEGDVLFTTENDYDAARGVVGIWDARQGYRRIGEFRSGGVGPHDIKRLPDGRTLVVANGGIETHPETGRSKLNLPTMRANLSYLDLDGRGIDRLDLEAGHQRNSIRHLDVAEDGTVAFAMQWQGDRASDLPLLALHHQGAGRLDWITSASVRRMNGYLGSVALSRDGRTVATTSPRSGILQVVTDRTRVTERTLVDVCGVAMSGQGLLVTTGTGLVLPASGEAHRHEIAWDNHVVPV